MLQSSIMSVSLERDVLKADDGTVLELSQRKPLHGPPRTAKPLARGMQKSTEPIIIGL